MRTSPPRGFSLLETMLALILVGVAMTALILAFVNSGKYGVMSRRQATALTVARTLAGQLNVAPWTDARFTNTNTANDATYTDPNGAFAQATVPTDSNKPDASLGTFTVGPESYDAYLNVAPSQDTDYLGNAVNNGVEFAVIVRYRVGTQFMRAVALGYRYNPNNLSVAGNLPL